MRDGGLSALAGPISLLFTAALVYGLWVLEQHTGAISRLASLLL